MGSTKPSDRPLPPGDDADARSARVRAMLARWEAEDVAGEPDWDVEDIEPVQFAATPDANSERT